MSRVTQGDAYGLTDFQPIGNLCQELDVSFARALIRSPLGTDLQRFGLRTLNA